MLKNVGVTIDHYCFYSPAYRFVHNFVHLRWVTVTTEQTLETRCACRECEKTHEGETKKTTKMKQVTSTEVHQQEKMCQQRLWLQINQYAVITNNTYNMYELKQKSYKTSVCGSEPQRARNWVCIKWRGYIIIYTMFSWRRKVMCPRYCSPELTQKIDLLEASVGLFTS